MMAGYLIACFLAGILGGIEIERARQEEKELKEGDYYDERD
jgi:hypothetical protein